MQYKRDYNSSPNFIVFNYKAALQTHIYPKALFCINIL